MIRPYKPYKASEGGAERDSWFPGREAVPAQDAGTRPSKEGLGRPGLPRP
jgi:hypothetical protein